MDAPINRPSNVDKMLLAGRYLFRPSKPAATVEVEVTYVHGHCTLIYPDKSEKLAKDVVPGWPAWQEYFARVR